LSDVEPLTVLREEPGPAGDLPGPLATLYGGGLALAGDAVYANFVTSLDGVASLVAPGGAAPALRGRCDADRLVMGLLRFAADAVIVGAGTLRADRGHLWTAAYIDRERAAVYRSLGRGEPRLVVVTAAGDLDPGERALEAGALVLTTEAGAGRLRGRLPATCSVRSLGPDRPSAAALLAAVRAEGHRRVLTEGGPTLLGRIAAGGLLDDLFLTLSPVLAGRRAGDGRLGLLEGVSLLPDAGSWARLRSVRAAGSHLFLRYSFERPGG
jgi:riboflavin biosynthesis pyrimidine reductase